MRLGGREADIVTRVLHLNAGNLYGGVESFLVTLAREARQAPGMQSSFAVSFDGRFSDELAQAGRPAHRLGPVRLSRPASVLRARRALLALLAAHPVDVVVCHQAWAHAVFGPAVRKAGLPLVVWCHTAGAGTHWLDRWARGLTPDLVVANSRFTAGTVAPSFPQTTIAWVYCPLTMPAAFDPSGTTRDVVRRALDTPGRDIVFVQVGRLEALKGHRTAIAALARLADVPGWTYWIVGGPQRASDERLLHSLRQAARDAGIEARVRFTGERRDVPDLLRAADIYVQPNDGPEAFGLSLVEAMAAGLPVVTSGIGGACEIVDDTCGVLVPPGDEVRLASELRRLALVDGLREGMGAAARRRPDVLCNVPRQLARIEDLLAGAAASRRVAMVS